MNTFNFFHLNYLSGVLHNVLFKLFLEVIVKGKNFSNYDFFNIEKIKNSTELGG
jgi:hypothetical protein